MASPEPESLPAALSHHAAVRPEEPWLFVREGWQEGWSWRWSTFAEAADRVALWARSLLALPASSRLAFPDLPLPRAVLLDLAIQAAGCTSVPVSADRDLPAALTRLDVTAWLGPALHSLPPGVAAFDLPEPPAPGPGAVRDSPAGGVLIDPFDFDPPDPPGGPRRLTQADLLASARAIQSAVGPPRGREREIAVLAPPLAAEPTRLLLAWATLTGAVLVLEPEPAALATTAAWARPTVFLGDAPAVAALRRALAPESRLLRLRRRRPGLPGGRLRTLLVAGAAGLPPEDAAFWTGRGVRLLPLP